jgi:hypothetical protein
MGPAEPGRDFPYLSNWMKRGYAIVATDYYGLGTPGLPAYLNGRSEAHNVVDMVRAARAFAAAHLLANQQLSNRWVAIGQSQGGGAAIYTARYATQFGGPGLDYLGAVGTGVPAYIEDYLTLLGPGAPPIALTPDINTFFTYMLASIREWRPQLGIDRILTPYGQRYLALADRLCVFRGMTTAMTGVVVGNYLTRPLTSLPNWTATIDDYMRMPESGFDKPFFMGHGLADTDVPIPQTARYVLQLEANHQPVTFKTYPTDHSGALVQSQKDEIPFVANLFRRAGRGPTPHLVTRLRLLGRPTLSRVVRSGLTVQVIADPGTRVKVRARLARTMIGSHAATTNSTGVATVTIRLTGTGRRKLARLHAAQIRIAAGGATLVVTLRG